MKSNYIIALIGSMVILALTSCAEPSKYYQVSNRLPQIKPGHGRIYIYQDEEADKVNTGLFGAPEIPTVKLNGESVGSIYGHSFAFVDKPAGHYEAIGYTDILTSLLSRKNSVNFDLKQGQTRFIEVNVIGTVLLASTELRLIHPSQGLSNLNNLTFNTLSSDDLLP